MVSYVYGFLVSSQYYVSKTHIHVVCRCSLFIFLFFLNIYLAAPGLCEALGIFSLHCGIQDLLDPACELLVAAGGIQFPDQGSNLGPLLWEHGVLATREVPVIHLFFRVVYYSLQELPQFVYLVYSWLDVFTVFSFHSYKRCCHKHWLPVCRHNVSLHMEWCS